MHQTPLLPLTALTIGHHRWPHGEQDIPTQLLAGALAMGSHRAMRIQPSLPCEHVHAWPELPLLYN
jgi:hypothetical protein